MAQLKYFITFLALVSVTAYGKHPPTSGRPSEVSLTTGRPFNQPDTLPVIPSKRALSIPGMVYIEGGYMVMGNLGEDKLGTGGRYAKPVTVNSFYLDQAPITNLDYREYLYDLKKNGSIEEYKAALPHQEVWAENGIYNDRYIENYLYAPGFMYYPVVGVTWTQATKYCKWRTNKFKEEEIKKQRKQRNSKKNLSTDDPSHQDQKKTDHVESNEVDATIYPVFRLATEAEWEYAARAIIGTANVNYLQSHQRNYPWPGSSPRGKDGQFLVNFKRGKGNYKGMAGESDYAAPTSYVYAYSPNDLGIYDMVGNVCCWVNDTYSPLALQDTGDLNPVKRDISLDHAGNESIPNKVVLTNDAKVYKGCSWSDCAYFLQIGTRRYLNKDHASAMIGFRCVVSSLG